MAEMTTTAPMDIGVSVTPIDQIVADEEANANAVLEAEAKIIEAKLLEDPLGAHILTEYERNRTAKQNSGIEDDIIMSSLAYNGEYDNDTLAKIQEEGGSSIYMNITSTRVRAAKSWISDVFFPGKGKPWTFRHTPLVTLPKALEERIAKEINDEFAKKRQELAQAETPPQPTGAPQPGQPGAAVAAMAQGQPQPTPSKLNKAQETLRELNQMKRDIREAIREEIGKEATEELKRLERMVEDQLVQGNWDAALAEFLDDVCIYPTAFMKGPVITKKKSLKWVNGKPTTEEGYTFQNERIDPLDMYPSPSASSLQDGCLIEHLRMDMSKLQHLKGVKGYSESIIEELMSEDNLAGLSAGIIDTGIEEYKADAERKGTSTDANEGVVHGLHFFGSIPAKLLKEWDKKEFNKYKDWEVVEVEAILVANRIIKCVANKDPLLRRPYFSASYVKRPGSVWGQSIPILMNPIQRMCNATARALANNLGIASGPQVEIYVDRLADNGSIEEIAPRKIWQVTSDATGGGGRAVNFFQPTSNARELLEVYNTFEQKADDVTGVPRQALGNERLAGAGITASGMAMILESASKIIKDAIRNIDNGLIKPRVELQFYWNMIKNDKLTFSGDINVVPIGSSVLMVKGFEAMRRNEFLQVTANPVDQGIMGMEGRAEILRATAEDMGLPGNTIPTPFELKKRKKEEEDKMTAAQEAQAKAIESKSQIGLAATKMQIEGQMKMHQDTMQLKMAELQKSVEEMQAKLQLGAIKIKANQEAVMAKSQVELEKVRQDNTTKSDNVNKELAFKMKTGQPGI